MTEPTMRERVARAILATEIDLDEFDRRGWDLAPEVWSMAMQRAEAAIKEMREPTDAILFSDEAGDALNDNSQGGVWRAMIDAAIAEKA